MVWLMMPKRTDSRFTRLRAFARRTVAKKGNPKSIRPQSVLVLDPPLQPTRLTKIDIEDPATPITIEMVMRRDIPVVTGRTDCTRHLFEEPIGDQDLEIAVDGSERERRRLRRKCPIDLGGGRMGAALLDPMQDRLSLARAIATRSGGEILGG